MVKDNKSLCFICKVKTYKYKCPRDFIPYCSVNCFKVHKEKNSCSGGTFSETQENQQKRIKRDENRSSSDKNLNEALKLKEEKSNNDEDGEEEKKICLRKLKDLDWPVLDDDQLMIFSDPLRRDEVKPIRTHEWEKIATCKELRKLLKSSNELRELIRRIDSSHKKTKNINGSKDNFKFSKKIYRKSEEDEGKMMIKNLIVLTTTQNSTSSIPKKNNKRLREEDYYYDDGGLKLNYNLKCDKNFDRSFNFSESEFVSFNLFFDLIKTILEDTRQS